MGEDPKFNNTILTNIGHQMLTSIASGNRKITYTKAEAYTQDVSSITNETLQALTSLQGKELSTNLLVSNDNGNVITITANFENKGLTSDAVFNSVGWFAKLDTDDADRGITANQEYLIGITPANGAQTLVAPPADQSASQAISLNLNMTLSDAANVNMTVSDAGAVHFNQLYDQLAKYTTTSDLNKLLAGKADLGLSYTKAELDAKLLDLTTDTNGKVSADQVKALISDKANISDVYTKSQIDSALSTRDAQINAKANASDVYTKSQIDSDFSARDAQINTKANISDVYTKSDVDNAFTDIRGRLGKLEGTQTLDSPDFNSITNTGVYYITNNNPANIKNNPVISCGVLVVSSGNGQRISQVYYPDDGSPQWCRLLDGGTWLPWYQLSTKKDVSSATDLAKQAQTTANAKANASDVYTKAEVDSKTSGTVVTGYDVASKTPTKVTDSYTNRGLVDQLALGQFADQINQLKGRQTVDAPDFNTLTDTGIYYISNPDKGKNFPTNFWGVLTVFNGSNNGDTRIMQIYAPDSGRTLFVRTPYNGGGAVFTDWQQIAWKSDITNLQNQIQANKTDISDMYTKSQVDSKTSGTVVTAYDIASKTPTTVRDSYTNRGLVDQGVLGQFADAINDINVTWNRYLHNDGCDLLTLWGQYGIHYCMNSNMTNVPDWFTDHRGTAFVFNFDGNSQTIIYAGCIADGFAYYNKLEGKWHKLATDNDITSLQNQITALQTQVANKMDAQVISQADYDKLATKDPNTLYFVTA